LVGWPARTANMRPALSTRGRASLAKNQDTVDGKKWKMLTCRSNE
jgi:hypothetical protein